MTKRIIKRTTRSMYGNYRRNRGFYLTCLALTIIDATLFKPQRTSLRQSTYLADGTMNPNADKKVR